MHPFPHISLFRNVLAYVEHVNTDPEVPEKYRITKPVTFKGTIKLHGSNCGVICTSDGQFQAQSRETLLSVEADYKGFAQFVADHQKDIQALLVVHILPRIPMTVDKVVLYGEWVGAGVVAKAKGAAVAKFDPKHWALFGVGAEIDGQIQDMSHVLTTVPFTPRIGNVHQIGRDWTLTIDFSDPASIEAGQAEAQRITDAVAQRCPYGAAYGLDGAGEGVVWMPTGEFHGREDLYWKHKSEAHSVILVPKDAKVRPEVPTEVTARIEQFVASVVTENRLEQGLDALEQQGLKAEKRNTGTFIQWVLADVERECRLELTQADLQWSQVTGAVTAKARGYFLTTAT